MIAIFAKRLSETLVSSGKVNEPAYTGLVCPTLKHRSSVWDSQGVVLRDEL